MLFLFKIGFLDIRIWDLFDILIVGWLFYQIYKLLRGSIAFNIFIGMAMLYVAWWLVQILQMNLLSLLLGQFVSVGVIVVAIIFQPEIRRFLLYLGNTTLKSRFEFWRNWLRSWFSENNETALPSISMLGTEVLNTLTELSEKNTGALLILTKNLSVLGDITRTGTLLNADISRPLLISIFTKDTPLHDGAVIIANERIYAARCILPLSDSEKLPENAGLRHRAALGISEVSDAIALIVSEETSQISIATKGILTMNLDASQLETILNNFFTSD
jgi:uncharacterized protein (TIGR00159 family)